jgi:hypothetical protein
MTPARKYTLSTSIFYLFLLALMPYFIRHLTAGPCNPGFGFFFLLLTLLIAFIGFISFGVGLLRGKQSFKGPLLVNGLALACLLAIIFASRA